MITGAYQFAVTGSIAENMLHIEEAVRQAAAAKVQLLVFPECSLTGYPPHDFPASSDVDFAEVDRSLTRLQNLSALHGIHIIIGAVTVSNEKYFNSAVHLSPDKEPEHYRKRALWGWDRKNFSEGTDDGIFEICGVRIGVRICYEVRFPEYFRELYADRTDLNIILFYDIAKTENSERYRLISAHIMTRAVENVCRTLSVNTCAEHQTAPTALFDGSGHQLAALPPEREGLLVYKLLPKENDFGEQGRAEISDRLLGLD